MNVIFLDYDGVINIPMWYNIKDVGWKCASSFSRQALQWISELCEMYDFSIVVSSTWRSNPNHIEYLYTSGMRDSVKVIGKTPDLYVDGIGFPQRGDEITMYLEQHPEVDFYLIFDDDSDMTVHIDRLIKTDPCVGFTLREFIEAENKYIDIKMKEGTIVKANPTVRSGKHNA